jgi:hypothetical protein
MTPRMNHADAAPPGAMKALGSVYGYVSQIGLPATLIDLVYLRVSQLKDAPTASTCTAATCSRPTCRSRSYCSSRLG